MPKLDEGQIKALAVQKLHTIVITPSMIPGRVSLRAYKQGKFKAMQIADINRTSICRTINNMLKSMGVPE